MVNKSILMLTIIILQGCGNDGVTKENPISLSIVNNSNTKVAPEDLNKSLNMLYASCSGLSLYKKDITSWEFIGEDSLKPFMVEDYGWNDTYTQFNTKIPTANESTIPADFYAYGHTCQYRISSNGEVDIMKTPCASVCLGALVPRQDHNHLIISGTNVVKW